MPEAAAPDPRHTDQSKGRPELFGAALRSLLPSLVTCTDWENRTAPPGAGGQRAISVTRDSRTTVTRIWPG